MKTPEQIWDGVLVYGWDKKRFKKELEQYATIREEAKAKEFAEFQIEARNNFRYKGMNIDQLYTEFKNRNQ